VVRRGEGGGHDGRVELAGFLGGVGLGGDEDGGEGGVGERS